MAQFTAKTLARVLTQVEREVLVEAVELADLTQFFTSAALGTLKEIQEFFNLMANIQTFGFVGLEKILEDLKKEVGPLTLAVGQFLIEQFVALVDIGDVGTASGDKLDDLLETVDIILETIDIAREEDIPQDIPTARALLVLAAENIQFAQGEVLGGQQALQNALVDARAQVEAAFTLLSGGATPS